MGRPTFKPSDEQRAQVAAWFKARVAIEEIARRLELAPKTLRKHFASELGLNRAETVNTDPDVIMPRLETLRPTAEQRLSVLLLSGFGISHEEIARLLELDPATLEEHFSAELRDGPLRLKDEALKSLYHQMKGGNNSATKAVLGLIAMGEARETPKDQPTRLDLPAGKKATQAIAAATGAAGTGWEDLVPTSTKPN